MNHAKWESEPDRIDFEVLGFRCIVRRQDQTKTLCGYIGIPQDHNLYGHSLQSLSSLLSSHAPITYRDYATPQISYKGRKSKKDHRLWVGFDIPHPSDYRPSEAVLGVYPSDDRPYRDIEFAIGQCEALAYQLQVLSLTH